MEIFKCFIKDSSGFLATYFINFFFIIIFYTISTEKTVEIIYPLLITLFIFGIFMSIRGIRYFNFNKALLNGRLLYHASYSEEEKLVYKTLTNIENKYIEEINKNKGDALKKNKFISQWIHNMKTPIAVMDLIIQRIRGGEIDSTRGIDNINEEKERLLIGLNQVLELYRLEDFSKDYALHKVRLRDLVKGVINEKKNLFIYNKIFPKVHIDEDIEIITDVKWSRVIIEQIVSNGIKYSNGENKNMYFTAEKHGSNIVFKIRDEGMGIVEEDLPRVFEAFFTGENGRQVKNSSGIGLFICKEISERLNHKLTITSKAYEGTEVSITYLSKL